MSLLQVDNIQCRYDDHQVISDMSFRLEPGQIACLLGPSGCGKTTALRAIAGFEPVFAGSISLGNQTLSAPGHSVAPEARRIGMVFQDYALFPHLTVAGNIGFALKSAEAAERDRIVTELLSLVQLEDHEDMWPHQLSGGQQQRVALARALAPSPELLLLDEPFSNLDTELRRSLSLEVRDILRKRGITTILVTHDRTEAFNMADEIGVVHDGCISQWGNPETLYHHPANAFVARFICDGRFLNATQVNNGLQTVFGLLSPPEGIPANCEEHCRILLRPWELLLQSGNDDTAGQPACEAEIAGQQFLGALSLTTLTLPDGSQVESSDEHLAGMAPGEKVTLVLSAPQLLTFPG